MRVRVTHGAPHNLIADSALCGGALGGRERAVNDALSAGDAWQRRRAEACASPEPDSAPVSLGIPHVRAGAGDMGGRTALGQPRTL